MELGERQIGEHKLGVKTGSDGTSEAPASTASTSGRASRAFHGGRRCRRTSYTRPTASRIPEPQPTTDRMRSGEDGAARCRSDTARGQSHTRTHGRRASTQILHGFCDTCANQARSRHIERCTVRDDTETRHNRNSAAAAVNRRHINKPGTRRHR